MPQELPKDDFRATRKYLTEDEFGISGEEDFVPAARIEQEVWDGLMSLPTDVSIRTTDFCPDEVKAAYQIATSWLHIGDPFADGPIKTQTFSVYEALEASVFMATTGWYRQAGLSLRAAMDDMILGLYYEGIPNKWDQFERIIEGNKSAPMFGCVRDALFDLTGDQLFAKDGGSFGQLYSRLGVYTHCIPNHELWKSNGPIYADEAFERWFEELDQTHRRLVEAITITRKRLQAGNFKLKKC